MWFDVCLVWCAAAMVQTFLTDQFGGLAGLEWRMGCIGPSKVA